MLLAGFRQIHRGVIRSLQELFDMIVISQILTPPPNRCTVPLYIRLHNTVTLYTVTSTLYHCTLCLLPLSSVMSVPPPTVAVYNLHCSIILPSLNWFYQCPHNCNVIWYIDRTPILINSMFIIGYWTFIKNSYSGSKGLDQKYDTYEI